MKNILTVAVLFLMVGLFSCESSDEISKNFDHEVPTCTTLTLTANGQTKVIDDAIVTKMLWGVVPQINLETISLPTITATAGSTVDISVIISDNEALKTAELSYSPWLYSKYINFANPEGDIPLTPQSYTFTAQITVPVDAVTTPWIETYYYNDGSSIKYTQSYHKLVLTLVDVNMNTRSIPIFVKVE
ncbi:MAG: hypothetical protein WCX31_07590 [Salinivirgaceae bacterium]|jgi:hypothetical protein